MHLGAVCRFYRSRKGSLCHFLNPRLNEKPRDVHLYCTLMAYRDNSCTTSDRYVKILDFRHFERLFGFDQSDRKTYKKAIPDWVNVSVVLDCDFGNTLKAK